MSKAPTKANSSRILFTEEVKQGRLRFFAGTVAEFEDPDVATFLDNAYNGTERTTAKPQVFITREELSVAGPEHNLASFPDHLIHPNTVIGLGRDGVAAGLKVMDVVTKAGE